MGQPDSGGPSVFISYSRKDFYFAESLAFHLTEQSIAAWLDANQLSPGSDWNKDLNDALTAAECMIVVLSPDSIRSGYVRSEWQRALELGHRVVLVRFRGRKTPPELRNAEVVDFRGVRFRPALQRLVHLLKLGAPQNPAPKTAHARFPIPAVPLWLAGVAAWFAVVVFARWTDYLYVDQNEAACARVVGVILQPVFYLGCIWYTCIALLRRRMGMTRLAVCLAFFTSGFVLNLTQHFGASAYPNLFGGALSYYAEERWPGAVALALLGLAALAVVVLQRPENLLRWSLTGTAWDSYRRGRVIKIPDIPARFAEIKSFELLYDVEDQPAATRLRLELANAGAIEAGPDQLANATTVVLLTNRTRTSWLEQRSALLEKASMTVVGTGIRVPESLRWLWRRQWIDFRRWDARRKKKEPVPAVPEALARLRIPRVVSQAEHLFCAMAGLLFGIGVGIAGDASNPNYSPLPGYTAFLGSTVWIVPAWRLVHRRMTASSFTRSLLLASIVSAVLGGWALHFAVGFHGQIPRLLPAFGFLIAGPTLLFWQKDWLGFWFRTRAEAGSRSGPRLAGRRNWEPVLWFLAYAAIWSLLLWTWRVPPRKASLPPGVRSEMRERLRSFQS